MRALRNLLTTLVLFVLLLAAIAAILIVIFAIALAAMIASSIVLRTMTKITAAVLGPIAAYILAFVMIGMWVAWGVWVTFVCSRLFLRALLLRQPVLAVQRVDDPRHPTKSSPKRWPTHRSRIHSQPR